MLDYNSFAGGQNQCSEGEVDATSTVFMVLNHTDVWR